jgi:hypothetical protein
MPFELLPLVKEIHRQARLQAMAPPAATRLVKLLYLADLEWRRRHAGEPLAQLTWRFLHFGPYATEVAALLGGPDVEICDLKGGKAARRLVFAPEDLEASRVPEEVSQLAAQLVKDWGDADLNMLLDHVYFETEPMEAARRGELLDFTCLRPPPRPAPLPVDQQKLAALRKRLRERVKQLTLPATGVELPLDAIQAARSWDEDDRPPRLPPGTPVKFSET